MKRRKSVTYNIREAPIELWERLKHIGVDEDKSLRELILEAIEEFCDRRERR